ncbi:50S ribosomal protein L10 [Candidatus Uzinura diaspidicola str. ASNER]|uniref:Large ribosomal subunit protein uL10 n=1 Tax=Candidatus Uzinura diaspidicola str. ASNER TaxID=1133592 RepID=L7VFU0_9FLAO|nr:50S ribosomal protein L10 [Candidatus Uzinura diaspidicola str. ASNER]
MTKEQKLQFIEILSSVLSSENYSLAIYLADISNMNAHHSNNLRRNCYISQVKVLMVKNTLLNIAMEKYKKKWTPFFQVIKGNTFIMISSVVNTPAKIIQDYNKKNKSKIPLLKAAYVSKNFYIGNDKLEVLVNLKSKEELIIGIISALQSKLTNVVVALQSPVYKIIFYLQKNINFTQ